MSMFTKIGYRLTLSLSVLLVATVALAQKGTVRGTVKNNSENLDGASVVVKGQTKGIRTNGAGVFELKLDPGTYTLVTTFVGHLSKETEVTVEAGKTVEIDVELPKNKDLSTVTVVGSRSSQVRTQVTTAVPVDVLSSRELAATGQVEPTQMINFVAPSFNSSRQTVADGTDHIDPATLRGLGPDQVLVLLNGHRRHNTALLNVNGTIGRGAVGTDMNSIPTSAIERIEILRDGASSQYGSDAIAGVINVVLKKNNKGTSISAHAGQQYEGDGTTFAFTASQGFALGKKGFLTAAVDARLRDATNRAGDFTNTVYFNIPANATQAQRDAILADDAALIAQRGFSRKKNMLVGNSEVDNITGMLNMGFPINENINFFANAGIGYRKGRSAGFYRYAKQTSQVNADLYPDGFLPEINSTINDFNATAGVDGKFKGWDFEFSTTYGSNGFQFDITNTNNASQFALGSNAPTAFYAGKLGFAQSTTGLNISKDFGEKLKLKSFNVAAGLELRFDNYSIGAGEEASWRNFAPTSGRAGGAQVFPGFQPSNAINKTRTVFGAYAEIETDLTEQLLLTGAGRYENYGDFGSNFAGKLAARFKLAEGLAIRAAISNGFRAPSMHQIYFSAVSTVFQANSAGVLEPRQQGTFTNESLVAKAFGVPKLQAETSLNLSFGITAKPSKSFTLTLDVYRTNIDNRLVLSGAFLRSTAAIGTLLNQFPELSEVTSAVFFSNAIDTRTTGLDLVASYNAKLGKGNIDFTLAGNFNQTEVLGTPKVVGNLPNTDASQTTLFNREERARYETGQPRNKISLLINYRIGKIGFMLRNTRFGEVATANATNPLLDESFDPKIVTDLSFNIRPTNFMSVIIGANNIGDVYPDRIKNVANTSDGRFVYSRNATQFGFNGGYYYTTLSFNF
jgi:iron complex outermembrane recepter protein